MKHLGKQIFRERRPLENIPKEAKRAIMTNPKMLACLVALTNMGLIGTVFYLADPEVLTLVE